MDDHDPGPGQSVNGDGPAAEAGPGRPDPASVRSVLREHGYEPPARGRLGAEWFELFDQIKAGTVPDGDDYGDGVTSADFPADDGEQPPRRRKPSGNAWERMKARAGQPRPGKSGGGRGKAKRAVHARVPVDRLIERFWEWGARSSRVVSQPLSRCLEMQAPVAGLVLEDVVRGGIVDRMLQPVARAEDKAEKVAALVLPPVIVLALEHAQTLPPDQRVLREAILVPVLRESMALWVQVAGDKVAEKAERDERLRPVMEKVDMLLSGIFAPPAQPQPPPSPEDEETARAQQHMAGV